MMAITAITTTASMSSPEKSLDEFDFPLSRLITSIYGSGWTQL
jgi:hypothetical protein